MSHLDQLLAALPQDELIANARAIGHGFIPVAVEQDETVRSARRVVACELVREGYLLHYASSRLYAIEDADLALLAGDRLYAAGLDHLAAAGDSEAVAVLADLIQICAQRQGAHGRSNTVAEAASECDDQWRDAIARLSLHAILARGLQGASDGAR